MHIKKRRKQKVVDKLCRAYSATAIIEAKASSAAMHEFANKWANNARALHELLRVGAQHRGYALGAK